MKITNVEWANARSMRAKLAAFLPVPSWAPQYSRSKFASDSVAALIVTLMLIPQSLAYALIAGLPPEVGLYASIAPLLIYALLGTSMTLAVGPVAIASLMTATSVAPFADIGTAEYLGAAIILACLSGLILFVMGVLRLGFLSDFLSHPVLAGFVFASAILISFGQVKHLLGIEVQGHTLPELARDIFNNIGDADALTLTMGFGTLVFLIWARMSLTSLLKRLGMPPQAASVLAKTAPAFGVVTCAFLVWIFDLHLQGLAVVGRCLRDCRHWFCQALINRCGWPCWSRQS